MEWVQVALLKTWAVCLATWVLSNTLESSVGAFVCLLVFRVKEGDRCYHVPDSSGAESALWLNSWSVVCMNRTDCFDPVIWKDVFKRDVVGGQLSQMFGRSLMYVAEKKRHIKVSSGSKGFREKFSSPQVMTAVYFIWLWNGWDLCPAVKPVEQDVLVCRPVT